MLAARLSQAFRAAVSARTSALQAQLLLLHTRPHSTTRLPQAASPWSAVSRTMFRPPPAAACSCMPLTSLSVQGRAGFSCFAATRALRQPHHVAAAQAVARMSTKAPSPGRCGVWSAWWHSIWRRTGPTQLCHAGEGGLQSLLEKQDTHVRRFVLVLVFGMMLVAAARVFPTMGGYQLY